MTLSDDDRRRIKREYKESMRRKGLVEQARHRAYVSELEERTRNAPDTRAAQAGSRAGCWTVVAGGVAGWLVADTLGIHWILAVLLGFAAGGILAALVIPVVKAYAMHYIQRPLRAGSKLLLVLFAAGGGYAGHHYGLPGLEPPSIVPLLLGIPAGALLGLLLLPLLRRLVPAPGRRTRDDDDDAWAAPEVEHALGTEGRTCSQCQRTFPPGVFSGGEDARVILVQEGTVFPLKCSSCDTVVCNECMTTYEDEADGARVGSVSTSCPRCSGELRIERG